MKLLLLDDHKLFGESIKRLLEDQDGVEVCDYVFNIGDFFETLKARTYDILLVDINLKEEKTGLDLIRKILEEKPGQKIVILTSYDLLNYKDRAFKLGVADFIHKSIEIQDLMARMERVCLGKKPQRNGEIIDPLTAREVQVLKEFLSGKKKEEIAKDLGISQRTLYNHMANIYGKLDVGNALEAYNKAVKLGYMDPLV